ncbi:D-arabinono-1,4-lactone oxidase [Duganella sp. Root1480D1]|uniref:D-arabinono-1,4-lactone oxidase n=1 Tax=Duganella sp. Root1480D1 TaxID=1736471 RepID=UPI00070AC1B1|nr:D-arabinono-1,4-lactone oxidase [Duganella sp. Root1480D1]KQZ34207.1 FAD-dependent oxidoreductase [Duganella sp. Root1480D1]
MKQRRLFLKAGAMAAAAGLLAGRAQAAPAVPRPFRWKNWSEAQQCQAQSLATPADEQALADLLRNAGGTVRCVGAGHSFTPLVPTNGTIVSLERLSGVLSHDKAAMTATLRAGTRLAAISRELDGVGLALRNLPDIDMQSLAGAISTGTHGTGANLQAMHADVMSLRLVTPQGEVVEWDQERHPEQMAAARVSLGSVGVITQATIRVVPSFSLHRKVWLRPVGEMLEQAGDLARKHRHFEFYYLPFTGYAAGIAHDEYQGSDVLVPHSQDEEMLSDLRKLRDWLGRFPEMRRWAAGKLIDEDLTEEAKNRSWKLLSTVRPTRFNETEYHVPREAGIACVKEIIAALEKRNEVYFPMEFRFVKGDDAWLSPFYMRDSCSIAVHAAHGEAYDYLVSELGPIFRKHGGRPHWGKLHNLTAKELAAIYPRWKDFLALRQQMDPQGRMLNPHLRSMFGVA